jgi:hypothetical protein
MIQDTNTNKHKPSKSAVNSHSFSFDTWLHAARRIPQRLSFTLRRSSLTAGMAGVVFGRGLCPLLVYRTKFPAVGGRYPPLILIQHNRKTVHIMEHPNQWLKIYRLNRKNIRVFRNITVIDVRVHGVSGVSVVSRI